MTAPGNGCPPVEFGSTEGQCIAGVAYAAEPYTASGANGKPARIRPVNTRPIRKGSEYPKVTFRDSTGLIWEFSGKKGRVVEMLATMPQGVTQWDCYPWHTRLGGSIHALREAGLSIQTEREGDYRHGRYFLRTPGCLLIQAENSVEPVKKHRVTP